MVNFALLLLLAMKNTPLSRLTGYSYERLNVFHRWVAVVAWIEGVVHTISIGLAVSRLVPDQSYILINMENIFGIVALSCWTIMMLSFPLLKRIAYEYFYIIHIVLFPAVAVTLYLHNAHCQYPVIAAASLYAIDRIIRTDSWYWHNKHSDKHKATLEVTADGATLVTIPRGNVDWRPGSHAFLRIPRVRKFQSHPFTIASVDEDEFEESNKKNIKFLIRPKKGFTRALHEEAMRIKEDNMPRGFSKEVTAYIDGPYGAVADFNSFDRVILIAAGSGITFILPIAISLIRQRRIRSLDFIWAIPMTSSLNAVRDQLLEISEYCRSVEEGSAVNLRIHITKREKIPRLGTIGTLKKMMPSMKRDATAIPELPRYDMFGSSMYLPMDGRASHMTTNSMEMEAIPAPTPKTWMGRHNRIVSTDSQASVSSDTAFLSPGTPPRLDFTGGTPLLASPHSTTPPLQMPQPRSGTRSNITHDSFLWQPLATRTEDISYPPAPNPRLQRESMEIHSITASPEETPTPSVIPAKHPARDPLKRHLFYGRPDIPALIADVIRDSGDLETIGVGACGVKALTDEVRKVVADSIESRGPSLSLFCEEFGW